MLRFLPSIIRRGWNSTFLRRGIQLLRESKPLRPWVSTLSGGRIVYGSFDEARSIVANRPVGYEKVESGDLYAEMGFTVDLIPGDYPAMFWLQKILPGTTKLFDYGGNIGLQYYTYSRYLTLPTGMDWTVCDIDPFVAAGIRLAAEKGATPLRFTYAFADGDGVDVFLISGCLHYIEAPIAEQLRSLRTMPRHLLINRVPLIEGPETITLQDIGAALLPCVIRNREEWIKSLESAGYRLCDSWRIPETQLTLPFYPDRSAYMYFGYYFVLEADATGNLP